MYYKQLKKTDEKLEAIQEWQKKKIIKLYEKTEKKVMKVYRKLGATIPDSVKGTNNERR